MFYIGAESEGGCGIYLDVHAIERDDHGQRISAIIGDGHYEGEVLIVLGQDFEVTFLDALWGKIESVTVFFDRHGEDKLRNDLEHALHVKDLEVKRAGNYHACRPHPYMPLFSDHSVVSEHWV